jgi:formylaminopyrimidine deformylase / aminopyrimidine aminohydrolase
MMKPADLLTRHPAAWVDATRHPFLDSVRDGTLPLQSFATWLVQDYLFATDELTVQAHLLPSAPRYAQSLLIGNLAALDAELTWFEGRAQELNFSLNAAPHPATAAYGAFMRTFAHLPFAAALTATWAIERAYLEAWQSALPGHPLYREYIERWTNPAFAGFVDAMEQITARALESGTADKEAEAAFLEVAELERKFWDMAWSAEKPATP